MDDVEAGAGDAVVRHRLLSFAASSHAVLDRLDRDAWGVAEGDLPGLVRSLGSLVDRVSAVLLSVVAEADARDLPARHGATSTAVWLRDLLNVTVGAAAEMVSTARAVRNDLGATGDALAAGTIGYAHAATITRAVTALPADLTVTPPARTLTQTRAWSRSRSGPSASSNSSPTPACWTPANSTRSVNACSP